MDRKPLLTDKELATLAADPAWGRDLPPLLTIEDIAAIAQVSVNTVYGWSSQGLLDDCKVAVGKHRRFLREKFLHLLINRGLHAN